MSTDNPARASGNMAGAGSASDHQELLNPVTSQRRYWRDPLTGIQREIWRPGTTLRMAYTLYSLTRDQEMATAMLERTISSAVVPWLRSKSGGVYIRSVLSHKRSISASTVQHEHEQRPWQLP
jgi:hypothetical protein